MYFSPKDKGEMMSMIYNWPGHQVDMIGIGIPIGKLDMYVAAAGINPHIIRREDLGLRQPWLEGEEYLSIVDEFMEAIHTYWLKAIVQVNTWCCILLFSMETVKNIIRTAWNCKGTRSTIDYLREPRDSCSWSWKGGLGVFNMAAQAVSRMAGAEANPLFFLLDKDGLITTESKGVDPAAAPFAKAPGEIEGLGLRGGANLIKVGALRTTMANPTMNAECTAVDAFNHVGENIVLQVGALSKMLTLLCCPITLTFANHYLLSGNGKVGHVKQANNMYLFPGIGMGALLSGARLISDGMSPAASECIQDITAEVGAVVVRVAVTEELAKGRCDMGPRELRQISKLLDANPTRIKSFREVCDDKAFKIATSLIMTGIELPGGDGGICQTQHVVFSLEPSGS
ncbi:unnamed protein product [Camellia sinensis]